MKTKKSKFVALPTNKISRTSDNEVQKILHAIYNELKQANLVHTDHKSIELAHTAVDMLPHIVQRIIGDDRILSESAITVGESWIGPGVIVGPNCILGPNAYLLQSVICYKNCRVGFSVELDSSILFKNVKISHTAFIGSSSVGEGCNIGYGCVTATGRLNRDKIKIRVKNTDGSSRYIISDRSHHGAVIGKKTRFGIQVSTMPGATVLPNQHIPPQKKLSGLYG